MAIKQTVKINEAYTQTYLITDKKIISEYLKEYEIDPEKISCIEFNYNIVSNVAFTNIYYKDGNFKNIEENVIKLSKFLMDNKIL